MTERRFMFNAESAKKKSGITEARRKRGLAESAEVKQKDLEVSLHSLRGSPLRPLCEKI
jgi:hypothetical protein